MALDLLVLEPGLRVARKGPKIVVARTAETIARYPRRKIGAAFLGPGVDIARAALDCLRAQHAPVLWVAENGAMLSWVQSAGSEGAGLRLSQAATVLDPGKRTSYAGAIIRAKLECMAIATGQGLPPILAGWPQSIPRLRGLEGDSTRAYFREYWQKWPPAWGPQRRSKHPPLDPANSILSLGYSLLSSWMLREIVVASLDPGWGYMHTPHHGMAALCQDLIEPFRSTLVNPWALEVATSGLLDLDAFEQDEKGCRIRDAKLRKSVVRTWLQTLDQPLQFVRLLRARTARKAIRAMVAELRAAIVQDRTPYFIIQPLDKRK